MSIDSDLRTLFREKANEVQTTTDVPAAVTRRAKQRIAMNGVAIGAMVIALGVGAFAGVRTLGTGTPAKNPGFASAAPSSCTSGQLRAVASLQGAAGSRIGSIHVYNYSDKTCTLSGRPTITLLDQNLHPITSGITYVATKAWWQVDAKAQPTGWPVVTIAAGKVSDVRFSWSNWCYAAAPLWKMGIPGSGSINVYGMDSESPPPCNGPGRPSTVQRGPFEPQVRY